MRWLACSVAVTVLGAFPASGTAWALNEVQLSEFSCAGLRVTQSGLPAGLDVEIIVLDPRTRRDLKSVPARTSSSGRLDRKIAVSLRGLPRVDVEVEVEVEVEDDEYGETGVDLGPDCRPLEGYVISRRASSAVFGAQPPLPGRRLTGLPKITGT